MIPLRATAGRELSRDSGSAGVLDLGAAEYGGFTKNLDLSAPYGD